MSITFGRMYLVEGTRQTTPDAVRKITEKAVAQHGQGGVDILMLPDEADYGIVGNGMKALVATGPEDVALLKSTQESTKLSKSSRNKLDPSLFRLVMKSQVFKKLEPTATAVAAEQVVNGTINFEV